jgi:hypothetical protein
MSPQHVKGSTRPFPSVAPAPDGVHPLPPTEAVRRTIFRIPDKTNVAAIVRTALHNAPSPHSPSKTGVNALMVGEGNSGASIHSEG